MGNRTSDYSSSGDGIPFASFLSIRDWAFWGKSDGSRVSTCSVTAVAGHWGQRLAVGGGNVRRPAKHSGTDGSLRRHRQEEVGDQLRLHVDIRVCFGPRRVGPVRLQHG